MGAATCCMIATRSSAASFEKRSRPAVCSARRYQREVRTLNAHAERWVRSIKEECLSKLILFGESSLRRVVSEYLEHYHRERNHQGKGNLLLFPASTSTQPGLSGAIGCRERLGGLLNYYQRKAA
jgi:hypothetical protein